MRDADEGAFGRWQLPIMLGLTVWGGVVGAGLIGLIGAEDRPHNITDILIGFFLCLWILRTTDPKTGRQIGFVVAVGAGVIALTVLAILGLFALFDGAGIREAGWLVDSGVRVLTAALCFAVGIYGGRWICNRLGVAFRVP